MDLEFDLGAAAGYRSLSQSARAVTEGWVAREMYCLACDSPRLDPTRGNTRSRDFECAECDEPYELKSSARRFGDRVLDGAYATMRATVESGRTPNLLLLEYDRPWRGVRNLYAVHRGLLTPASIVRRSAPLGPHARRAGWWGCSIDLAAIPSGARIPVVDEREARPAFDVRSDWGRFAFTVRLRSLSRGWVADTLSCLDRLPEAGPFRLEDVYVFERDLQALHPENRNVRPKIRQQLQVLEKRGIIHRLRPGLYERSVSPQGGLSRDSATG